MPELSPYGFTDRLLFAGMALLACLIFGSLNFRRFFALPILNLCLRNLLKNFDRRLNRSHRSDSERKIRGAIVLLFIILTSGFAAFLFSQLISLFSQGWWAETALLAIFVPARLIYDQGNNVFKHLKSGQLNEAREDVHQFSLQDTHKLDPHGVIRSTIEYMAGALADRVISPIFWYILLGLPGFAASKVVTEAALLLDYDSSRHRSFGQTAGAFEQILNYLPSRLAGLLIVFAALFVPKGRPVKAMHYLLKDSGHIHLPRKGVPIAATAGALGISLAGPRAVQGYLVKDAWVGTGTAKASLTDLRKKLFLYTIACLLNVALIAILLFALAGYKA